MHPQLELLITLHDLELMIKEASEETGEKAMGFKIDSLEHLTKAQTDVEKQVDKGTLQRYQKLQERYGRPVVPVIGNICCGCYIRMPTAVSSDTGKNTQITMCGNCGRFLYWITE